MVLGGPEHGLVPRDSVKFRVHRTGVRLMQLDKIPTTVVTGFLGSGKTTLLS